jgi:hypothetical protein
MKTGKEEGSVMRRFLALLLLQGLRRYSKKQPSHVSLYLAFQLQYSPVQTATEHFATVLAPYPNWSDSVGHPEFCTDAGSRYFCESLALAK